MRYVSRWPGAEKTIRATLVQRMARVGFGAEGRAKAKTRVKTGNARRSLHTVVIDERGTRLDGPSADENGRGIPEYPATGHLCVIVGSNCGYYKWLEIGARGRAGDAALAGALAGVDADVLREFRGLIA